LVFEGATDDGFETTIAVVDPTADRTITLPNVTGTVVTTGDSGTVTSTMIANDTIVDADINSAAAITLTKLGTGALPTTITVASGNIVDGTISNVEISASAAIADTKLDTISTADKVSLSALNIDGGTDIGAALADADLFIVDDGGAGTNRKAAATRITDYTFGKVSGDITITSSGVAAIGSGKITSTMILDGTILNADVNASAAIAGTKISPDFGSQTIATTGIVSHALGTAGAPTVTFTGDTNTGIYSPGADQVAISTNGTGRLFVSSNPHVGIGVSPNASSASSQVLEVGPSTFSSIGNDSYQGSNWFYTGAAYVYKNSAAATQYIQGSGNHIWLTAAAGTAGNAVTFSEKMRITSAGLLGLGTSSPGEALSVVAPSTAQAIGIWNRASDNTYGQICFKTNDGATDQSTILNTKIGTNGAQLSFYTKPDGGSATERLTIDSSGRVGIGTTSPDANSQLHVVGSSYQPLYINTTGTGGGGAAFLRSGTQALYVGTAGGSWLTGSSTADGLIRSEANLIFGIGNSEKTRIDSSGRLLVGTSSSAGLGANLQVRQNNGYAIEAFRSSNDANGSFIWVTKSRGTEGSPTEVLSGDSLGGYGFRGYDGAGYVDAAYIYAEADADWTTSGDTTDNPSRLVFSTTADGASSPTERMRITNLGVPRFFSSDSGLIQAISAGSGTNENIFVGSHSATSNTTGSNCILIKANGNIQNTNNSYTGISDIKLKENIVDAGSQWDDLKALRVVKYNLKPETNQETHTQIGLIAQEVELVCPRLVKDNPDRNAEGNDLGTVTKSVNYSVLYMKAVKALQEAMERIEALEAKVAALEAS
jgi:hypothetical protein